MKLVLLGDIAFFGNLSLTKNKNLKLYFKNVSEYLSTADYVVGNLETPFSLKKHKNGAKSAFLYTDVENQILLTFLNINAVSLANNHMFDYGKEGYELTKKILDQNNINYFGTEGKDLKINIENNKLAFNGFCCYSTNPLNCVPYGKYGINELNVLEADKILKENDKKGFLNILSIHSGIEHINYPSCNTITLARKFAKKRSYIYYGHHPHVSQGIEKIGDSLLAYSLGNFCFDDVYSNSYSKFPLLKMSDNNRSSFMLEVFIENNKIVSYNTIPIFIGKQKLQMGKGTDASKLKEYSKALIDFSKVEYTKKRNELINDYLSNRKKKRNVSWFLKRLRPRYFFLILDLIKNKRRYNKLVAKNL